MASLRLIAGPNGSGKTTLTKLLREEYAVPLGQYLNPDDIAKHISFFQSMILYQIILF
ncbi:ATP-binding cassette domain-containing protein [Marinomonas pontica]|uniref:ATP-binding cassette domain-containing protein n=1 Tax=Marinomonas pontica TaxID=264739 RepID=UPI003908A40C